MSNEIKKIIIKALSELGIEAENIHLEHPVDLSMGDYSTNVAMVYAKEKKTNPKELAEKIVSHLVARPINYLDKVEVAGPGFINFYLSKEFFEQNIVDILKTKEKWGSNEKLKGQKILIEHSSPNLFKEFHIGHMVNNSIGEAITRIIKNFGADVKVISYPSDVGLGIAKVVSFIDDILKDKREINSLDDEILKTILTNYISDDTAKNWNIEIVDQEERKKEILIHQIVTLGGIYVASNIEYKNKKEFQEKVTEINKKIYDKSDKEINKIYEAGKRLTLQYFEKIVARLGSKFDDYIFESEAGEVGKKLVEDNIGKVFKKSDGAVIFNAEKFDESLHTRVFLNSQGLPTYEAKDLGLLKIKFDKYNPDKSIFITDNEQNEYMKVMLKATEQINPDWVKKTKHIGHGRLRFPEGRLSSREGNVLTAVDVLDEVRNDVWGKMNESNKVEDKKSVSEKISVGAVKYSILKSSSGKNIVFDKEKALSLEGNSGPYLQYTYARAKSVLDKAKQENIKSWVSHSQTNEVVGEVEKLLYRFPEVVERAGQEYEPHYIATYLFELAQAFNSFYGNNKIADKTDENAPYKVALTEAVAHTIKNGLYLLGIETPERL